MHTSIFIALLNPALCFLLAATFAVLWLQPKARTYLAVLAGSHLATGAGFVLQYVELPIGFYPTKFLSNLFFLTGSVTLACAIIARIDRRIPYAAFLAIAGAGLVSLVCFMTLHPSLGARITSTSLAVGGIALVAGYNLWRHEDKTFIDKVLLVLSIVIGVRMVVGTPIVLAITGNYTSYDGYFSSAFWASTMLTHAILSVTISICLIVAASMETFDSLRREAHTDPLSGLLNRRGFEERALPLVSEAMSGVAPLCLILADLDHFKRVNDLHGHAVGDSVIVAFSRLLRESSDREIVVGRTGGEEFALLLPARDVSVARLLAEGLRVALCESKLPGVPDQVGPISASFGVAGLLANETLTSLFRRADEALYGAKHDGRNRVRVATADAAEVKAVVVPSRTQAA